MGRRHRINSGDDKRGVTFDLDVDSKDKVSIGKILWNIVGYNTAGGSPI